MVFLELRSRTRRDIWHALSPWSFIIALGDLIWGIIFSSRWRYRGHQLVSIVLIFKLGKFGLHPVTWNTELLAGSWDHMYSHVCATAFYSHGLKCSSPSSPIHPLRPIQNITTFGGPSGSSSTPHSFLFAPSRTRRKSPWMIEIHACLFFCGLSSVRVEEISGDYHDCEDSHRKESKSKL